MEPTEVLFCGFLGSKPILPRVWGGWWLSRPLSIDDCCVRGPFFCGLQCYGTHDAVIVGDFWKIVRTPDALLNIYVFVETCGTDKSCGNSCCECSVCVRLVAPRFHVVSFQRHRVFSFADFPRCLPFASLMCRYSNKTNSFVHHATTHALSLHPLSCLLRVVV